MGQIIDRLMNLENKVDNLIITVAKLQKALEDHKENQEAHKV